MNHKQRLFLVFNHKLTAHQCRDAKQSLGVESIIELPAQLQDIWAQVPPEGATIENHIAPVQQWLEQAAKPGDYVLIQGDFGATYHMVCFALNKCLTPVYATTRRCAEDMNQPDGSVKTVHHFVHQQFRRYAGP